MLIVVFLLTQTVKYFFTAKTANRMHQLFCIESTQMIAWTMRMAIITGRWG